MAFREYGSDSLPRLAAGGDRNFVARVAAGQRRIEQQLDQEGPSIYAMGTQQRSQAPAFQKGGVRAPFSIDVEQNPEYFYGDKGYMARLGLLESTKINGWNIGGGPAPDSQTA